MLNAKIQRGYSTHVSQFIDRWRELNGYGFPRLGRIGFNLIYKLLPRQMDTQLLPGIRAELDFSDEVQQAAYWLGARMESPMIPVLTSWIENSQQSLFFDIGSNFGFFSFQLASRFPELQINAFEPNPNTFLRLKTIIHRNRLHRITPWSIGLGDRAGEATLHLGEIDSGHSTFGPHPELKTKSVLARIEIFDTWRKEVALELPSQPNWVAKIDVEGYECKVISGMKNALEAQAFRGLVVEANVETLRFCGASIDEMIDLMEHYGYTRLESISIENKNYALNKVGNVFFVPRRLAT